MNSAIKAENIEIIKKMLSGDNVYAVTDSNVFSLYPELFKLERLFVMPFGEQNKNLSTVGNILSDMTEKGCDRKTLLIAVGGGVVGDTAGFVASIFMRGIEWINVPTTLLAQVDSGIGGKTGVDIDKYKNIAGSFHMPKDVYICTDFLHTLPQREWLCGVGEIIKHAFLDEKIYEFIRQNLNKLLSRDNAVTKKTVDMNVSYKESIVREDFREGGLRKRLNAGHTVGHSLEKVDGFKLSHGEYVAAGLIAEMKMFEEKVDSHFFKEACEMAELVCPFFPAFLPDDLLKAAKADKKNSGGKISFMIAEKQGVINEYLIGGDEFLRRLKCL